jgi:hypothetical protein
MCVYCIVSTEPQLMITGGPGHVYGAGVPGMYGGPMPGGYM